MIDLEVRHERLARGHAAGGVGVELHGVRERGRDAARDHEVTHRERAVCGRHAERRPPRAAPAAAAHAHPHRVIARRQRQLEVRDAELACVARRRRQPGVHALALVHGAVQHDQVGDQRIRRSAWRGDAGKDECASVGRFEPRQLRVHVQRPRAGGQRREHRAPAARDHHARALERVGLGGHVRVLVHGQGQFVVLGERAVVHHHRHAELGVRPHQHVHRKRKVAHPAIAVERCADGVVDHAVRRAVAHVDLAALVPRAAGGVVEQEIGLCDARPVLELRLVLGGGQVGVVLAPEAAHELGPLRGGQAVELHRVPLARQRCEVLEALADAPPEAREREPEHAVRPGHVPLTPAHRRTAQQALGAGAVRLEGPVGCRARGREVTALDLERRRQEPRIGASRAQPPGLGVVLGGAVERAPIQVLEPVAAPDLSQAEAGLRVVRCHERGALESSLRELDEAGLVVGAREGELDVAPFGRQFGRLLEIGDRHAPGLDGALGEQLLGAREQPARLRIVPGGRGAGRRRRGRGRARCAGRDQQGQRKQDVSRDHAPGLGRARDRRRRSGPPARGARPAGVERRGARVRRGAVGVSSGARRGSMEHVPGAAVSRTA